ncbi:MAG TPA: OmpH family outer membrane protein [Bacteroidales bacterium]|nr:OmpH family outer membrane protein [Bacteroidales bacterium]
MKNLIKVTFLFLCFYFVSYIADAQQQTKKIKFGHIDSGELLSMMPGRDSAQKKLQEYAATLSQQLKTMQAELDTKEQEYRDNEKSWSELIRSTKYKELMDLSNRIEAFQSSAQEDLQKKEQELLQPIIDLAKKAIEEVAKEQGYTYILDTAYGIVLFADPSDDIMPLVKKKLNLK